MQPQLNTIIVSIEPAEISNLLESVFTDLNRLLGYLKQVRTAARIGDSADAALFLLDVIRSESLAATGFIDFQCASLALPANLCEELERVSFAVRHELKSVFDRILNGVDGATGIEEVCERLADAHDLLHNCFQQSTIALARVFEPELDGQVAFPKQLFTSNA